MAGVALEPGTNAASPEARGAPAIATRRLRKVFGDKVAVRGLTLDVRRGEVFGFLGPNGAGKSTAVKILLGLVKPSGGSAELLGAPIGDRETRARIGFLPEQFRFYDWLTAAELLKLHGRLCAIDESILKHRVPMLLDLVGLTPHMHKQIRQFSKGMVQRAGLAQALINAPDLLFLDEPTSGLDPIGRKLVREIITAQRERGTTVFLNSHLLSEVECTCDRVAFIRKGEVIETRPLDDFSEVSCAVSVRAAVFPDGLERTLSYWGSQVAITRDRLTMRLSAKEDVPRLLRFLVDSGLEIYEFTTRRTSLEDRFMEILGTDEGL